MLSAALDSGVAISIVVIFFWYVDLFMTVASEKLKLTMAVAFNFLRTEVSVYHLTFLKRDFSFLEQIGLTTLGSWWG